MQISFQGRWLKCFGDNPVRRVLRQGATQGNGDEEKKAKMLSHDAALETKNTKRAKGESLVGTKDRRWSLAVLVVGPRKRWTLVVGL
jgi:hypothetical protein